MKKVLKFIEKNQILLLMLVFILIRLPLLDQIFLLHDERDIVFSGYSIAQTGKDLFGRMLPVNFSGISPNNPLFSIYFSAIISFFIPFKSVFTARLPYVVISSLLIPLVYWLVKEITKDNKKSILTSIVFAFSPWVFHITRLALDIPLAIVTLIGGMLLLLKNKRLLAYLMFFVTFYNYQGFRLLIPFLLIYLEIYLLISRWKVHKIIIPLLMSLVFILFLLGSTFIIDQSTSGNRLSEIIFFSQKATDEVIFRRTTSIAPAFIQKIIDNKITVSLDYMLTNFIKGQDLTYLFKDGDYSAINGNTASGQFLFVFIIMFFLGIASFGKKILLSDFFVIGLIAVGMIPSLLSINGSSFSIRAMLTGIGFAYIISSGVLFSKDIINKLKNSLLIKLLFVFALMVNLSIVSYIYFFRRPITISELFNENERTLSQYLLTNPKGKATILAPSPQDIFLSLSYLDPDSKIKDVQINLQNKELLYWRSVKILKCNSDLNYYALKNAIIAEGCLSPKQYGYFADINNPKIAFRIKYKDYSTKTAFFVTK